MCSSTSLNIGPTSSKVCDALRSATLSTACSARSRTLAISSSMLNATSVTVAPRPDELTTFGVIFDYARVVDDIRRRRHDVDQTSQVLDTPDLLQLPPTTKGTSETVTASIAWLESKSSRIASKMA